MTAVREEARAAVRHRLAQRAAAFGPSFWGAIDAMFALHPAPIFFGGGIPAPELMPIERMRLGADRAWADGPAGLGYGEVDGYLPLRELIAARMRAHGTPTLASEIVTTHGSQQGIDLIAKLLLDPGDAVVVEAPTFLDAIRTFDSYEATFIEVPVDDDGMRTELLADALAGTALRPKMIYTVPTFQNPTGTSLSLARRHELLALAHRYQLTVVEDDPYSELRYDGMPLPALRALDAAVVYLGTFSKTLAPGLRVGWAVLPDELNEPFQMAKESADSHTARMMTRTVYHAASEFLDRHVASMRDEYRARRDVLLAALAAEMPAGVRWSEPEGGFFVWVTLPGALQATELLPVAAAAGVIYLPGTGFYASGDPAGEHALRLNFSALTPDEIREGMRRLGAVMRAAAATGGASHQHHRSGIGPQPPVGA